MKKDIPEDLLRQWGGRRYNALSRYLMRVFGERTGKIAVEGGFSCPNRDGRIGSGGCVFCLPESFSGQKQKAASSIHTQINTATAYMKKHYGYQKYVAYFQTYTNTYGPVETLKAMYDAALEEPCISGLAVATRPDCLDEDIVNLLETYNRKTVLWVELGLQSAHDTTLKKINRGHDAACFADACKRLHARGIEVCAHVIAGLPGETVSMMLETIGYINALKIEGLKIHQLQVIRDTPLEKEYDSGAVSCLDFEEFLQWNRAILSALSPEIVVHRLFSLASAETLIAPKWAKSRREVQTAIEQDMETSRIWQGKEYAAP